MPRATSLERMSSLDRFARNRGANYEPYLKILTRSYPNSYKLLLPGATTPKQSRKFHRQRHASNVAPFVAPKTTVTNFENIF